MVDWPGCCAIVCVVCYSLSISRESCLGGSMVDWPGCCAIVCVVCYSLSISPESPAWVGAWWIGLVVVL